MLTKEEKIESQFTDIIREQMTDREFWKWATSWLDVEDIIDQAEDWDLEDKKELVNEWNKQNKKRK